MSLNDPFGRVRQKQQSNYDTLRESLKRAGVNSRGDAQRVQARIRQRAWLALLVVALILAPMVWLFPGSSTIGVVLGTLILLWVWVTARNGHRHVQRYIEEELQD
ncbi:MAG: hypothetical protein OES09_13775 [Gammaproteobacteria bacterium]|nr:hypothetical protein [Gammaproteobacteria bacterium]